MTPKRVACGQLWKYTEGDTFVFFRVVRMDPCGEVLLRPLDVEKASTLTYKSPSPVQNGERESRDIQMAKQADARAVKYDLEINGKDVTPARVGDVFTHTEFSFWLHAELEEAA